MTSPINNSIQQFKTNFYGGTRANRFKVSANWPTGVAGGDISTQSTFKIIATSFPDSTVDTISLPYRGRLINYAGDRKYGFWDVTVYDDNETNNLWEVFHKWMEKIDGSATHLYAGGSNADFSYSDYQGTFTIQQYKLNSTDTANNSRTIILKNVFPITVGEIGLDMSKSDIVSFKVQLSFDYITFGSQTV